MIKLSFEQQKNIGFRFVLDLMEPNSPYGAELVRRTKVYSPSEKALLADELYNVQRCLDTIEPMAVEYSALERRLMALKDIRKSCSGLKKGVTSDTELFEIKRFLLQLELIKPLFDAVNENAEYKNIGIAALPEALGIIDPDRTGTPTFMINDTFSEKLAAIRRRKRELEELIRRAAGEEERHGLLLERAKTAAEEAAEEADIRTQLCGRLSVYADKMLDNIAMLGRLDFVIARARLAKRYGGVCPTVSASGIAVRKMTNPAIAKALGGRGSGFTPLSVELDTGAAVITGANMGGKSVLLKTLALNVLLTHCGIFPFAEAFETELFDSLFILMEDGQSYESGLSSFGAEIARFNEAVKAADEGRTLLLADEFARGTNPHEGARIVRGAVKYFGKKDAVSVFTTHYDGVAEFASAHYQVVGLKNMDREKAAMKLAEGGGTEAIERFMDYGIYRVSGMDPVPREALVICELLGLDDEIMTYIEETE